MNSYPDSPKAKAGNEIGWATAVFAVLPSILLLWGILSMAMFHEETIRLFEFVHPIMFGLLCSFLGGYYRPREHFGPEYWLLLLTGGISALFGKISLFQNLLHDAHNGAKGDTTIFGFFFFLAIGMIFGLSLQYFGHVKSALNEIKQNSKK